MAKHNSESNDSQVTMELPLWALELAALGQQTKQEVIDLFKEYSNQSLFSKIDTDSLRPLAESLRDGWSDIEAARVVGSYLTRDHSTSRFAVSDLCRWIRSHKDDSQAVIDCMDVIPPDEINLIRLLSRAGSQKLVFLATWKTTQTEVVLKQVTGPPDLAIQIIAREQQPHPLSLQHPNIIETYKLQNDNGDIFLVERKLPTVLHDSWQAGGMHEAANLLVDIAKALQFLHRNRLVHGDVKPDNIGQFAKRYILLDFGICRPVDKFTSETTPTGSLRTRAPELLISSQYLEPPKVDVWALAATVFNSLTGRFPLFRKGETPPRISHPTERSEFETDLRGRVENEWDKLVDLSEIPEPLREILANGLRRDPSKRCSADDLLSQATNQLPAFLRGDPSEGRFAPVEELKQLKALLPSREIAQLMPTAQRDELRNRLQHLKISPNLENSDKDTVDEVLARIG